MDEKKYKRYFLLVFAVSFLIRFIIASFYGLTGDEAHYWQYAKHPSLSYFDHPPLVGYAIFPFTKLLGDIPIAVRMPALICSSLCIWLLFILGKKLYDTFCGFWAVVIFCIIPLFSVLGGIMIVPDTLLSLFWLLSLMVLWKIYHTGKLYLWYILGLLVGLSLLSKYSGILLYPAILLFMIIVPQMRHYFKKNQVYYGFIISLLVFSPVIIWNYNNCWVSFIFQFKHGLGEKAFFNPTFFVQNIIAQMAVISPLLWIMILIVFVHCIKKAFTSSDVLNKLFLCFSLPVFVVFGYASLSNEILPHWPAVFYLTLILPSANLVNEWLSGSSRKKKNFIRFSLVVGLFFTLIIPVQIVFKCFPISSEIDPTSDVYGWDIAAGFAEYLCGEIGSDAFLFTHKFYPTGQIAFYLSKDFSEKHLFCLSRRIDQYDFWQKDINLTTYLNGKTGIFFTDEHFKDFPGVMYKFKKIENPFQIDVYHRGKKVKSFFFYKCHDFKTFETDPLYFNSLRFYQRDFFRDLIDIDNRAFISLNKIAAKNKWLANLLFGVGLLGSTEINVLVVSILLYLTRRDKFLKYLGLFVFALLISAVVIHMLKEMFPTSRPVSYFSKEYAVYITGPVLKSGSFPSGHAQTSFLAASFLSWVFPCYSILFFFLASIISFSRVFSGVHFFRDIIAGGILGFSAFWIVLKLCRFFVSSKCIEKDKIA